MIKNKISNSQTITIHRHGEIRGKSFYSNESNKQLQEIGAIKKIDIVKCSKLTKSKQDAIQSIQK